MYYLFQQRLNNLMNFSGRCWNADGLLEKIHTRTHITKKNNNKLSSLSLHTPTHTHTRAHTVATVACPMVHTGDGVGSPPRHWHWGQDKA